MTSQRVERTWIRTGGYRLFRGEWVKGYISLKAVNPPRLQLLRIDRELREGIIDDIITHST